MLELEFVFENDNHNNIGGARTLPTDMPSFSGSPRQSSTSSPRRRSVGASISDIEFSEPPKTVKRRAAKPKVNYVKSVKRKRKSTRANFEWSWMKAGWLICGCLLLRLTFMSAGIIDYYSMEETLSEKTVLLEQLKLDNIALGDEINKIKSSSHYQRKLAREHLGVLAKDEYLILFARDSRFQSI